MQNLGPLLILAAAALAGGGALVATLSFLPRRRSSADLATQRIESFTSGPVPLNLDPEEAQQPFSRRVLGPLFGRFAASIARRTPEAARARLQQQLRLAGRPLGLDAADFLAFRYALMAGLALAGLLLGLLMDGLAAGGVGVVLGALAGFTVPRYMVASRVKKARRAIRVALPDSMDLMSVSVEAGLTFEGAMQKVAERFDGKLGEEFAQVLREVRLGRSRQDALTDLGDRCGVDELHGFTRAVVQSDLLGTGIARVLKLQSDELRRRRRQRAQEMGARATLKMLFPMLLFIFPALFIVLLGPAALMVMKLFGGGL